MYFYLPNQVAPEGRYRFKLCDSVAAEAEKANYAERFIDIRHKTPNKLAGVL